ncbi:hypothetical protein SLE2022_372770 [Rubroshorea leprosula]
MPLFNRKGPSGFSGSSTAEEVTQGIDGTGLTAIVTGASSGIGAETARVLAMRGKLVFKGVEQGAATTCYVALHPKVEGITGEYFKDCNIGQAGEKGRDAELAKKLWDFSMDLIK